jgi:hypothetical protein
LEVDFVTQAVRIAKQVDGPENASAKVAAIRAASS